MLARHANPCSDQGQLISYLAHHISVVVLYRGCIGFSLGQLEQGFPALESSRAMVPLGSVGPRGLYPFSESGAKDGIMKCSLGILFLLLSRLSF